MMHPSTNGPQVFHPAENANASTQPDEEDAEEQPVSLVPSGKGKSRTKLSNFSPEEDVNLVKTYLEISNGPKKGSMWLRILQLYNTRRGSYPERNVKSLQCRWHIIRTEVGKFSSFYADVIRENPSGMSDADKTTHAAANFAGILKHNFAYLHCWEIMKDDPIWQDAKPRAFVKSAEGDGFGEDTIDLGDDKCSPTGSAENRPIGRDQSKAAKKKENSSAGSASSLEHAVTMMHPSTNGPQVFHPAENANASVQPDEEDAEEQPISPAPLGKGKRTEVVSRIKLGNFNPEEDVNVVKSWLETRCEPITSAGPKKERMWLRIQQRYNLRRGSHPERSVKSLQSRWDTIKAEVGKFSSFYADVIRENPSGMSDADKTTHAAANFALILKHNFPYLHCWEIMKDEPNWQDPKPRAFAKSAGGDGFGEGTTNLGDDKSSPTGSAEKRPMGRDQAKAAKKANSSAGSASSLEYAVTMMHPSTDGPQVFQPAENANASVQPDEEVAEEQLVSLAPSGKGKRTKVVSRIKLSNFNPEEDVNVVKSWLETRCDPITSTGPKKEKMWLRIQQRYNLRRGSYPERTMRSLQSRWDTIKAEVGKFSSFYADVIQENPSGMSDADKTTRAAANFAGILKHNFAYLHCWEIMKDEPKWQDPMPRAFAESAGGVFGEDTINLGDDKSSPTGSSEKRPMGRDQAEAAKKKDNSSAGSASSSKYAVTMMHPSTNGPQVFHPAENTNASVQPDEEDVEEQPVSPAPSGKRKRTKVVSRIKLSNFNPEEDVNVVKSWLEIRCDPITSAGPKKERMWLRIQQRYNLRRGSHPERSVKSIQSRWDTIKAEVGKFSSFYADVIREDPSRMSDADKTTRAAANFAGILKHNFAYLHCWEIMKDEPKWQDPMPRVFAESAGGDGFGEDTINLGDDKSSPTGSSEKRPMGRDQAEAAKKKDNSSAGSASSSKYAVTMMHPSTNGPQVFHRAENANASAQPDKEDVEEQPVSLAPSGKGKRTKVVSRIKLSNFNPEEDVNVVKSWLEIRCDPITSVGPKKERMWLRIQQQYNLRRGSHPERSVKSIQSRWDTIKAEVGKFSSFYADVIRENPSGMSDADKTALAAANFAGTLKHYFAYLHCWEIMKDEPKWLDPKPRAFAKSAGGDGFGVDTINRGNDKPTPTGSAEKRPMGRDQAKAAKKKENSSAGSTSSSEYASRMQDLSLQKIDTLHEESVHKNDRFQQLACIDEKHFEEMRSHNQSLLAIEQEKIRIIREKHEMDKEEREKQEDERILGIDLNACTPAQRLYYEALQEEILEKIAARRRKRKGPEP